MIFREFQNQDREYYFQLSREFYASERATEIKGIPDAYLEKTFHEIISKSPYVCGFVCIEGEEYAGYCLLSFTFSNEFGGKMLLLEELFISEKFQGKNLGKKFVNFLTDFFQDKVKVIRLEVLDKNDRAIYLYEQAGFKKRNYMQMIKYYHS